MRTEEEIRKVVKHYPKRTFRYGGMDVGDGIEKGIGNALRWVLGENNDFDDLLEEVNEQ